MYLYSRTASSFIIITTSTLAACQTLVQTPSKDNSPQCSCYLISGAAPGYFQHYRFWDFRSIPSDGNNHYTSNPPLVSTSENDGTELVTSSYFDSPAWKRDWTIQTWIRAPNEDTPIRAVNSPRNVFISRNTTSPTQSTYLTLRASRLNSFTTIAEIDSTQDNLKHLSTRARIRVLPNELFRPTSAESDVAKHSVDRGAVFGFFTYANDTQESDLEVLTRDPTDHIHCTNQPDSSPSTGNKIPDATTNVALPHKLSDWTEWHDYRIDWLDGISYWYVDGQLIDSKKVNVPHLASWLILNLWSDGGVWSGNMSVGGQVQVAVEWIEVAFNVSGPLKRRNVGRQDLASRSSWLPKLARVLWKRSETPCQVRCTVDDLERVGYPQVAAQSTGARAAGVYGIGGVATAWLFFYFALYLSGL